MKRIYFAMDNHDNAGLMRQMLERLGYQVRRAVDGNQLLQMLEFESPDLILLDIEMPYADGCSTLTAIRDDLHLELPIVAMSGGARGSLQQYRAIGFTDYLANPFSLTSLRELFAEYLV